MSPAEKTQIYHHLLSKWGKKLNLISLSTLSNAAERHFKDSTQLLNLIRKGSSVLDLGSGAGFPGMVLAIHGLNTTMVESDQKKCIFLENVSRETKTPTKIVCSRIETVTLGSFDIITSRGLASLGKLISISQRFAKKEETKGIFLKGASVEKEIQELTEEEQKRIKIHQSSTNKDSKIVEFLF